MREVGLGIALTIRADVVAGGRVVRNGGDGCHGRRRQPRIGARRILRNPLTRQCRVGVTLPVVAVVEWDVLLVAFAQLDRRGPFGGIVLARNAAHSTDIEVRVLRHPAVQLTGGAFRIVPVGGRPPLPDPPGTRVAWRGPGWGEGGREGETPDNPLCP